MWLISLPNTNAISDNAADDDDDERVSVNETRTTVIISYNNYFKLRESSMNNRVPVVLWVTGKTNI